MLLSQYYLPQTELEESTKDAFYDCLQTIISKLPDKEIVISWGDWNRPIVKEAVGYEGVHGGYGYGERMQTEIEYLTLLVQVTLSLGILSLTKDIVTLSLINQVMQKPRLTSFF